MWYEYGRETTEEKWIVRVEKKGGVGDELRTARQRQAKLSICENASVRSVFLYAN